MHQYYMEEQTPPADPTGATGSDLPEQAADEQPKEALIPTETRQITRKRLGEIQSLFYRYGRSYWPAGEDQGGAFPEPPKMDGGYARLLPLLRIIPWTLLVLFGVSFLWDFPGATLTIFGFELSFEGLLRILAVSGLIGFLTNWLAINMLFHPRERRPLFGQGLIPAQRERVVYRLATTVSEELINVDIIKAKIEESGVIQRYRDTAFSVTRSILEDEQFRTELKGIIGSYTQEVLASEELRNRLATFIVEKIESYAGEGLGGIALKTYRLLNEGDFQRRVQEAVDQLPTSLEGWLDNLDPLLDGVPERIEARSEDIEQTVTGIILSFVENLDIYSMVASNMQQYDENKLEQLIKRASNEQLNYIKYLGGVLGCIGGLVIWEPLVALAGLGSITAFFVGLDMLLYRRQEAPAELEAAQESA